MIHPRSILRSKSILREARSYWTCKEFHLHLKHYFHITNNVHGKQGPIEEIPKQQTFSARKYFFPAVVLANPFDSRSYSSFIGPDRSHPRKGSFPRLVIQPAAIFEGRGRRRGKTTTKKRSGQRSQSARQATTSATNLEGTRVQPGSL